MSQSMKYFSTKLREARKQKNITQKELAKILKVDTSAVCLWESGKREPSGFMMLKLIQILGLKKEEIVEG